jgi:hypothetical protein
LFRGLVSLNKNGPVWNLRREKQNDLFSLSQEFKLVEQVRDLIDELNMISRVYEDQAGIIDALADSQYYDALYRGRVIDEEGNRRQSSIIKKDGQGGWEAEGAAAENGNGTEEEGWSEERKSGDGTSSSDSRLPVAWDERSWFLRTKQLIYRYQEMVYGMVGEANLISESVRKNQERREDASSSDLHMQLQSTINLKQNSGSLFEAHASRKEAQAIMVFTLVSSCVVSSHHLTIPWLILGIGHILTFYIAPPLAFHIRIWYECCGAGRR